MLDLVAGGDCVLIFDGLDEVLVHLDPHAGQVFTRTLWRAHYFRTIRHETTHFTGQHRDGPTTADYLALLMLPFNEEQVRAYLTANLPGVDVDRLLELIDSVHNLREIIERPLTLRMVAEQLETVERAKLAGRTAWGVLDIEQWLLEFLNGRPDLELHYPARVPDLWKEDLRTATFLVRRDDDTFGFAHTSLREYFLARYLGRALEPPPEQARQRWQLPAPSRETIDFLGQWLARRDAVGRARDTAALAGAPENSWFPSHHGMGSDQDGPLAGS